MTHDFDRTVDFRNVASRKWDVLETKFGLSQNEGLAMWIADMDFLAAEPIREAVSEISERGLFTYYTREKSPTAALAAWLLRRHQWKIEESWVRQLFGVVPGIAMAIQEFTDPDDAIIAFTPVYPGIPNVIRNNARTLIQAELAIRNGRYEMDLDALSEGLTGKERMVVLCSPHNPGGRVWSAGELQQLATFCDRNDLLLVSDEVHQDLVFDGAKHIPMAVAAPEITPRLITLTSPSKAFNVAGATTGFAIIEDTELRRRFSERMKANGNEVNRFGSIVAKAAYDRCEAWLDDIIVYLDANRKLFSEGVNAIPGFRVMDMQATYLAWVDFSGTGMAPHEIADRIEKGAGIAASPGAAFGNGGESFMRFNLGMPKARIVQAVERLQAAFSDLQ